MQTNTTTDNIAYSIGAVAPTGQNYNSFDLYFQNDINMLCIGCMLFYSNNKTISLMNILIENINDKMNSQLVMNQLLMNNQNTLFGSHQFNKFLLTTHNNIIFA